jgi:hypothetical protein
MHKKHMRVSEIDIIDSFPCESCAQPQAVVANLLLINSIKSVPLVAKKS